MREKARGKTEKKGVVVFLHGKYNGAIRETGKLLPRHLHTVSPLQYFLHECFIFIKIEKNLKSVYANAKVN